MLDSYMLSWATSCLCCVLHSQIALGFLLLVTPWLWSLHFLLIQLNLLDGKSYFLDSKLINNCSDFGFLLFQWLKKSDLLDIADHYGLPNVKKTMLKYEIKNILIQFFVKENIFDSSATSQILVTQTDLQLRELEIKRQVEMEKLRLDLLHCSICSV